MSALKSPAPETAFSSQVLAGLRPSVLPRELSPPSREEAVGSLRSVSRPTLATGEAVGPLQSLGPSAARLPRP